MEVMVLEGDGIGPEIVKSATEIISVLKDNYGLNIYPEIYDIGSRTVRDGKWTLEKVVNEAKRFNAILKAPMGDPSIRNDSGTEVALDIILGLRFELDLFANIRPVKLLPGVKSVLKGYDKEGSIDYTILRENSEGLYASHFGGLILHDEIATDEQIITRMGSERIFRYAFKLAEKSSGNPREGKKVVTCVDKSNVLKSFAFFRKIFVEVSKNYQDIDTEFMYADAMAQYILFHPDKLNIIVTENMLGDILSDLGAATVGGLGLAYSANVSEERGMFEPVHGSAVDIAGKGIANPTAMIMSLSSMLEWLGFEKEAKKVENSLRDALRAGVKTPDMGGDYKTSQFTKEVIDNLTKD
ncbi:MAG: isocitrate/isopropylmalate dehydrogenase family protein [Nitrososphaerota archaeon]